MTTKQLALADIAEPENATPLATEASNTTLADNGKLWEKILKEYNTSRQSLDNLGRLLGEAVDRKIWLGMINPKTGRLCNFSYTNGSGELDHSLSFKMWLSTSPERGGLGISDLSIVESAIKKDQELKAKIIPLIVDKKSILLANKIRSENGEPPLLSLNPTKEGFLRRLGTFPPVFTTLLELKKVHRDFLMCAMGAYDRLPENRKPEAVAQLEYLLENSDGVDRTEISLKISRIVESDYFKAVKLSRNDLHQSAQKIVEFYDDDPTTLRELAKEILGLID